jgi:hypothetical protein
MEARRNTKKTNKAPRGISGSLRIEISFKLQK